MEPQGEDQVRRGARPPILFHHVVIIPEVRYGIGATVGTVMSSQTEVITLRHGLRQVLCSKGWAMEGLWLMASGGQSGRAPLGTP